MSMTDGVDKAYRGFAHMVNIGLTRIPMRHLTAVPAKELSKPVLVSRKPHDVVPVTRVNMDGTSETEKEPDVNGEWTYRRQLAYAANWLSTVEITQIASEIEEKMKQRAKQYPDEKGTLRFIVCFKLWAAENNK